MHNQTLIDATIASAMNLSDVIADAVTSEDGTERAASAARQLLEVLTAQAELIPAE